jgi:charged multivesicular body protein 7
VGIGLSLNALRWGFVRIPLQALTCSQRLADAIIAAQDEKSSLTLSDSLYTTESFKKYAESCSATLNGRKNLSETDVKVLIKYLARDRRVAVVQGDVRPNLLELSNVTDGLGPGFR